MFASLGLPLPGELEELAPDFALAMEPNYFVHFDHEAEDVIVSGAKFRGMHGHHPEHEALKAVFVAAGPSIRPGYELPEIKIVDIAPTIMRLIGEPLADIDGQPLDAIWKDSGTPTSGT